MTRAIAALWLIFAVPVHAQIYKCVDADGNTEYTQTPCAKDDSKSVQTSVVTSTASGDAAVDCRWASMFATDVARRMQAGQASDEIFNMYGGLGGASKGTINIINYVYRFRANTDVSVERIASLAGSMCKAGSLGDVSCEALPYGSDPERDRCDPDYEEAGAPYGLEASSSPPAATAPSRAPIRVTTERSEEEVAACKKRYRDQIDAINARMRSGYSSEQGEQYREQLRALSRKLREC